MLQHRYLSDRIIILDSPIDDENASVIVEQLIYLNDTSKHKDISLLIDCPGGSVAAGFAIYDTMRWCECNISTICLSMTAGFASLLLSAGTKGKRYMFNDSLFTPTQYINSESPKIYTENAEILNRVIDKTIQVYADITGNTFEVMKLACLTGHILSPAEAVSNGFVDHVIGESCVGVRMLRNSRKFKALSAFKNLYYNNIIKTLKYKGAIS
ncbi:MAG: ATP-dependent Clp protease proteolytic subunit [Clostridia bacterium]|nr:ATP-dependent Clp protease proteolytic subunit [Clostridia bacterium]